MRLLSCTKTVIASAVISAPFWCGEVAALTLPAANGEFDYQIGGPYTPLQSVKIVIRDRNVPPVAGKYNICYVNTFQTQPSDREWWIKTHPNLLVKKNGQFVIDPGWPDELIFDTSTAAKRNSLLTIVGPWIDKCAKDKFHAIEPDNLDSWLRAKGVVKQAHNAEFAKMLAKRAHAANLAIAQKNASELAPIGVTQIGFDFAIVEECQVWKECTTYTRAYGNRVYEIEYNDNNENADGQPVNPISFFNEACGQRGKTTSIIYRDRKVLPGKSKGYVYKWC